MLANEDGFQVKGWDREAMGGDLGGTQGSRCEPTAMEESQTLTAIVVIRPQSALGSRQLCGASPGFPCPSHWDSSGLSSVICRNGQVNDPKLQKFL